MIGLNGSLIRSNTQNWWPSEATFFADFVNNRYMKNGTQVAAASAFGFSRASAKMSSGIEGTWHSFAVDVPATTNKGLLLEGAETYYPTNSTFDGAAIGIVGADGSMPNGWDVSYWSEVEVVALTNIGGLDAIIFDLTLDNTYGGSPAGRSVQFCSAAAELGENWTMGGFFELVDVFADDTCTAPSNVLQLQERSISNGFLNNDDGVIYDLELAGLNVRQLKSKAISDVNTATLGAFYSWNNVLPGEVLHRRCAIALPTANKSNVVSSPLPTTDVAVANRAVDAALLFLPASSQDLTIVYDDGSEEVLAGVSGETALPLNAAKTIRSATAVIA